MAETVVHFNMRTFGGHSLRPGWRHRGDPVFRAEKADSVHAGHPARQIGVGAVVLGLHLLMVVAWWTSRSDTRALDKHVDAATTMVWLSGWGVPATEPVKQKRLRPVPALGRSVRRERGELEPASAASLETPTTDAGVVELSAQLAAPPWSKHLGAPLNLSLSRQTLKSLAPQSLAERSPFQARLPLTVAGQIAEVAAETGSWTEERIDADHIRLRRGTTCVMLSRPEIAKIDPFSDSIRRLPWSATVFKCR